MSFGYYVVVNDIMDFIWYVNNLQYKTTNRVRYQYEKRLTKTMTILSY